MSESSTLTSSLNSDITIRQASLDELSKLLEWRIEVLREVFSLPAGAETATLLKENEQYYVESIPTGKHIACFAECKGDTIGCGGLCIYKEMPSPDNATGMCAYLMNIYVRKQFRRRGIGMKIVQYLIDQAKALHITKIYLESSKVAIPLYQEIGFEEMKDMMILK